MAVAQERPFSADDNERLMVRRAPLAHIREWVPDKFLVRRDHLVCVPLTHEYNCWIPPLPDFGERIEVRGILILLLKRTALAKHSLSVPPPLSPQKRDGLRTHSLATSSKSKLCPLQIPAAASHRPVHSGFLLSGRETRNRVGWFGP